MTMSGRDLERSGVLRAHGGPPVGNLRAHIGDTTPLPRSAGWQGIPIVSSDPPGKFRLPELVARILRPASQRHEHLMEIGFQAASLSPSRLATRAIARQRFGRLRDMRAKPAVRRFPGSGPGWRPRARPRRRFCRAARTTAPGLRRNSRPPTRRPLGDQPRQSVSETSAARSAIVGSASASARPWRRSSRRRDRRARSVERRLLHAPPGLLGDLPGSSPGTSCRGIVTGRRRRAPGARRPSQASPV